MTVPPAIVRCLTIVNNPPPRRAGSAVSPGRRATVAVLDVRQAGERPERNNGKGIVARGPAAQRLHRMGGAGSDARMMRRKLAGGVIG
jgi:hypothetical protein